MKLRDVGRRFKSYLKYRRDYRKFEQQQQAIETRFDPISSENRYAILGEDTATTSFDRHYVYHTAWAARILNETANACQADVDRTLPIHHDFASQIYFPALVSAFRPIRFYDYRPAQIELSTLESVSADLTSLSIETGSLESASCMHVIEHIGLGRYGDPVDAEGDKKAAAELQRVVASKGDLLIVVPVGDPRICFNAHRIYSYEILTKMFSECDVVEFSLIKDPGQPGPDLERNADPTLVREQQYACGCFWFRKK